MKPLAEWVIDVHGGLVRWKQFEAVSARLVQGGLLWQVKGRAAMPEVTSVTVGLRRQWALQSPFGADDRRARFEPNKVVIETAEGAVLDEIQEPRTSFLGHGVQTPWTETQQAYFAGYAMWTYFNTPFVLTWPGVSSEEISPWRENGDIWRRLVVRFPESIVTHCGKQTLYFDERGLLRRQDYNVEIAGGIPAAHYVDAYVDVFGIKFPTVRRVFARYPDDSVCREGPLVISIGVSDISLMSVQTMTTARSSLPAVER
jgi:hypothetical protein